MTIISVLLAAVLTGCAAEGRAANASARLKGTLEASRLVGLVSFEETAKGLKVTVTVEGAPAGQHGLHIHDFGSCEGAGEAAGGHYNPKGSSHGHAMKDSKRAHPGDMGNITVGADGKGRLEAVLPMAGLTSKLPVAGRSVILHEKIDDFSQPAGNAGARIACGLIGLAP